MNTAELRRLKQLKFLVSKEDIEIGKLETLPISINELKNIDHNSSCVEQVFDSGLTAVVYKLNIEGSLWTLKKKRENILVKNVDGQTSFLNEVQRRRDFERLKAENKRIYNGIVDTKYASLKHGIILSPWIEGQAIKRYSKALIEDLFNILYYVEIAGLFECDLCSGNILAQPDGSVRLFDFGYMYPFNPLKDYNSDGKSLPIFHSVERFETRSFMQYLMDVEDEIGIETALEEFRIEKSEALKFYLRKRDWLIQNNADHDLIHLNRQFIQLWETGLANPTELKKLYDLESFRSYILDIHDDIGGKSCNPDTLRKIDKVLIKIHLNFDYLKENRGLFWGDERLSQVQLIKKYQEMEVTAKGYQIENLEGFSNWRGDRLKAIRESFGK